MVGIPVGIGLDRVDNRWATLAAAGVLFGACLWSWLATENGAYWSLFASRAVAGLSFPVIWSASINLIGRTFDASTRATAVGVFTTSAPAGFAIGQFAGPLIVGWFGAAAPFAVFGATIGLAAVMFWVMSGQSPAVDKPEGRATEPGLEEFRHVLTNQRVLSIALMGFLAYSAYVFFNSWMPTYLTDQLDLSLAASGVLVAVFPAIGVLSRSGSGFVSDRFLAQRRRPLVYVAFGGTFPLVAIIAFTDVAAVVGGCLLFAGLFIQAGIGILFTYIQESVRPAVAATALATLTTMSSFGSFTAPLIAGFLIDSTQTYFAAFGYAAIIVGLGIVLAHYGPTPNQSPSE